MSYEDADRPAEEFEPGREAGSEGVAPDESELAYEGVVANGDAADDPDETLPGEHSEAEQILAECDPIHLQFRGEQPAIPIARTPEQLEAAIKLRCKPGLQEMVEAHGDNQDVEYAGYALARYTPPTERLAFKYPEATEALKLALLGSDLPIASGPRPNPQDYWLERGDCFDLRALAREFPEVWRVTVSRQTNFVNNGYILGPAVRLKTEELAPADEYNQPADIVFDPNRTVYIPGDALLDALCLDDPRYLEGYAIERGAPAAYLARAFGLEPANEQFRNEWAARRRAWEAQQEPEEP